MKNLPAEIMTIHDLHGTLNALADAKRAVHAQRFFKTGRGEYAEGDVFLGITVPTLRALVKRCESISIDDVVSLLGSPLHEERLLALFLLVERYKKGSDAVKARVFQHYLRNTDYVNNWDLVDCSAHLIAGAYLEKRDRSVLFTMARSKVLWARRIAVIATYHFIKRNDFDDALALFALLRDDAEDLMHKAVGWMLREIGKRDQRVEEKFLRAHYKKMPRTMLRYAIERFPEMRRKAYLEGSV
jgi:3-methyladenine DNA glycosylase AlkD